MPPKRHMPLCPSAIAVSKPKRDTWMEEELLDTLIPWDPNAQIKPSGFPGVLLVYTKLDPYQLGRIISSGYHAFVKRVVPAQRCLISPSRHDLLREIEEIVMKYRPGRIRLSTSIRGTGKTIITHSVIEEFLRGLNVVIYRKSKTMLCIESVNELFIITLGEARFCGPDCIMIIQSHSK
ncbi:MAG: hypothetical protein GSR85_06420 [Desulfurococcales archaeon]|nr:hypothetical protein [Desulfurococcales archaeon]